MKNTCGYCMFKEPIEPEYTDIIWCWKLEKRKDVMDPSCACFKKELKFSIFEEEG